MNIEKHLEIVIGSVKKCLETNSVNPCKIPRDKLHLILSRLNEAKYILDEAKG